MTPATPCERAACDAALAERTLSSILHALAGAGTLAGVDTLTRAYAEQSARLAEMRRSEP